jgi:Na+/H+ antiporter NhaD/arsenite permease-like protein
MDWLSFALAAAIFLGTYVFIFLGFVHRALAALIGAVAMIVVGVSLGFYSQAEVIAAVDFGTVWLLMGMMIIVGLLQRTGFFQYMAIRAAKLAHGDPKILLISLSLLAGLISAFLDNVTTMLTFVPVTLSVTEILGLSPLPFLVSEILAANIGGVATLVGDPPHMLIGSAAAFSFNDFLSHTAPVAILALIVELGFCLIRFRSRLTKSPENAEALMRMDERQVVTDPSTMRRLLLVFALVVLLFLVHQWLGLSPGIVALIGAAIAALAIRPKVEDFLSGIDWELLIFLIALFVVIGGLDQSGVLPFIARGIMRLGSNSLFLVALAFLWLGAILTWVISAIPTTIMFIPIVRGLGTLGVATNPLWWALALGIALGSNGTPFGAAANIAVVNLSEQAKHPLGYRTWLATGLPVSVLTCALASLFLWLGIATGWFL